MTLLMIHLVVVVVVCLPEAVEVAIVPLLDHLVPPDWAGKRRPFQVNLKPLVFSKLVKV